MVAVHPIETAYARPARRSRQTWRRAPTRPRWGYRGGVHDEPLDPFRDDPVDPSTDLDEADDALDPLTEDERHDVEEDLADLETFQVLLTPAGIRGLVIDCEDCREPHYFDWALLRANLRHLLDSGRPRVHEPAYDPDPDHYVTWEYARGYSDGVHDTMVDDPDDSPN
jgi:Family of unknown function (DUF5319)